MKYIVILNILLITLLSSCSLSKETKDKISTQQGVGSTSTIISRSEEEVKLP